MSLAFIVDHRADVDPNGDAVADESATLTNEQLLRRVRSASRHLRDLGVRPGDVVALKLTNRVEFVVLLFAAWRIGAAITPINPSLTDGEVDRQLTHSGARLLVTENTTPHKRITTLDVENLCESVDWPDLPAPPDPSALALLIYTSSTTGTPKGVMLDHANLDAMAAMGRDALELGPADRCLLILPLFHVNGIVVSILTPLLAGASVVIAERFDPRTFFDLIEQVRPTYFSAVPTIYNMLAALPAPHSVARRSTRSGTSTSSAHLTRSRCKTAPRGSTSTSACSTATSERRGGSGPSPPIPTTPTTRRGPTGSSPSSSPPHESDPHREHQIRNAPPE